MLLFAFGALIFSALGLDYQSAFGVSAASLGNIGPAIGDFGPSSNYASLPTIAVSYTHLRAHETLRYR